MSARHWHYERSYERDTANYFGGGEERFARNHPRRR